MSRKQPNPAPNPPIRYGTLLREAADVRDMTANGLPVTHVVWHATAVDLPEDHEPVLMVDDEGEVWPGFRHGATWRDIEAMPLDATPKFWCYFPEAPK